MRRFLWAVALVGELALICWQFDFIMALPEPWLSFVQVGGLLLIIAGLFGIFLSDYSVYAAQAVIAVIGVLYMVSYIPMYVL